MSVWFHHLRSIFAPPRPVTLAASGQQAGVTAPHVRPASPPITDLDLLRALGCDV